MELSIIIINWNTREMLMEAIGSIYEHLAGSDIDYEIIVVDNASEDGSPEAVKKNFPEAVLIRNNENIGFGRANNIAMNHAKGEFVLLLNSDAKLINEAPVAMIEYLKNNPRVGIVAPKLLTPERTPQVSYGDFPSPWMFACERLGMKRFVKKEKVPNLGIVPGENITDPINVDYVSGAAMMIRRSAMEALGRFDPGYRLYFEETDLCFRAHRNGIEVHVLPQLTVMHHLGKSLLTRQKEDEIKAMLIFIESEIYFYRKNYSRFWGWIVKTYYRWHHGRHYYSRRLKGKKEKAAQSKRYLDHLKSIK